MTTTAIPHSQLDQQPTDGTQLTAVLEEAGSWSGVVVGPSGISVPGACALLLADGLDDGPADAFLVGREFCHGHAQGDHSLHLALPPALALEAEQAGWVEPHFLARQDRLPRTIVMLYAPRNADEVAVATGLVRASLDFARGDLAPTHLQEVRTA